MRVEHTKHGGRPCRHCGMPSSWHDVESKPLMSQVLRDRGCPGYVPRTGLLAWLADRLG